MSSGVSSGAQLQPRCAASRVSRLRAGKRSAGAASLQVIERVRRKAATFGQDLDALPSSGSDSDEGGINGGGGGGGGGAAYKIRPEAVAQLYEQWVMPLTKEVEVQYLLMRLED